ncbi:MAG: pyruvate, phosphate dikinase, partial [Planctomycetota bacterium]
MAKFVYFFGGGKGEGNKEMKATLGGKGANLAEMTSIGLPVPPGFTITAEVCDYYYRHDKTYPPELDAQVDEAIAKVEKVIGRKFGDTKDPLLFSVRSGAAQSMPGMMDTVLNLGMNEETIPGLIKMTGNERLAWDSYRRFINMFGGVVMGVDHHHFEEAFDKLKKEIGAKVDTDLDAAQLKELCARYSEVYEKHVGEPFPREPKKQLQLSIDAVFGSWNKPSAVTYRRINRITGLLGTAVNVQTMVFGNMGETSGTGVAFTRDPSTGENVFYGEFLMNAQGEDVVAGIRTPREIAELGDVMPEIFKELEENRKKLEEHYKDVQDFEFTIENGTLFMLQTRNGKRTGFAAFRIAAEMVEEGLITPQEAVKQIDPDGVTHLLVQLFEPKALAAARDEGRLLAKGLNAGPGAASGEMVFSADRAEEWSKKGKKVVLCRTETSPDDIHGMHVSEGILTQRGGMTSHAAVVARQIGTPCVAGCDALDIDYKAGTMKVTRGGKTLTLKEGELISLDGITGEVFQGPIATMPSEVIQVLIDGTMKAEDSLTYRNYAKIMGWANEFRKIGVR